VLLSMLSRLLAGAGGEVDIRRLLFPLTCDFGSVSLSVLSELIGLVLFVDVIVFFSALDIGCMSEVMLVSCSKGMVVEKRNS
jgi:hypothetical protein